ncbi:hypothetical protein DTO164E3_3763 [Paecilomyces variotii]|nr:hypothetical protein DTO164E3_3763 [Paecilomyces variotii]KAJ9206127.1 hypothetical protein DTO032I3_1992 [Paecilomyces variotii]KAJ9222557.1 hypothetical protein DTO169C6_5148 [Paecilomyces variotii]KAJ9270878.1 hypothetical protein DTO212C5_3103 [Paecilomyces variotii]KAJ9281670.1 hypothetical protein DTO021D3_1436 [Paecilomyces variotii]
MIIYLCTVIILSNNTLFSAAKKGVSFPVTRSERGRRQGKVLGTSGSRTNTVAGQVPETCLPPLQGAHARSRATRLFRPPRHLRGTKQPRIRILLASSIELFHYLSPFPLHILAEIAPCGPGTGVCPPDLEETADLPFIVTPFLDSKARGRSDRISDCCYKTIAHD